MQVEARYYGYLDQDALTTTTNTITITITIRTNDIPTIFPTSSYMHIAKCSLFVSHDTSLEILQSRFDYPTLGKST
jgi:hypothetical protein